MTSSLDKRGFQLVPDFLSKAEIGRLRAVLEQLEVAPGHRRLMQRVPEIETMARSAKVSDLLSSVAGPGLFPVRSIFFDKTPQANWLVPWHQDLSIAVKQRIDLPGYGPWSIKDGLPHVQPPREVLESMITARIHLDDCDESNGALQVIPGSHLSGRLDARRIAEIRTREKCVLCSARVGDILLMRPLLLHASSEARVPSHRRVIHLEYASVPLPPRLEWAEG